jgi:hypothetical protein
LTPAMTVLSTKRPWLTPATFLKTPLHSAINYTLTVSTTPEMAGGGVYLQDIIVIPASARSGRLVGPSGELTVQHRSI